MFGSCHTAWLLTAFSFWILSPASLSAIDKGLTRFAALLHRLNNSCRRNSLIRSWHHRIDTTLQQSQETSSSGSHFSDRLDRTHGCPDQRPRTRNVSQFCCNLCYGRPISLIHSLFY